MGSQPSTPRASPKPPKSDKKKDGKQEQGSQPRITSYIPKDVMISYSHQDKDMCQKLRESLENSGISVWVDVTGLKAGVDFLSKIGQAIIDAKLFISLLSESTIRSKYCQDELALAYVSNKPIFPVGIQKPEELFPDMDTGMKLQLARFEWNPISMETFEEDFAALVENMKATLAASDSAETDEKQDEEKDEKENSDTPTRTRKLQRQTTRTYLRKGKNKTREAITSKFDSLTDDIPENQKTEFWESNFGHTISVPWEKFIDVFVKVYGEAITKLFSHADQEWIASILNRELEVGEDDMVHKDRYQDFITIDNVVQPFWIRVQDQAVESYSMREVFNMESSVRIEAIENLGKFRSSAVVEALLDLLQDKDNNVKAVAAISLAKTGKKNKRVVNGLLRCLNDKDRLVRESGCLALGHIKAQEAVSKLVALWRNDTISSVRDAAHLGLEQIGGAEAEKAIHMTKVLAEEIRMLTKE